jgi:hypothetical protein
MLYSGIVKTNIAALCVWVCVFVCVGKWIVSKKWVHVVFPLSVTDFRKTYNLNLYVQALPFPFHFLWLGQNLLIWTKFCLYLTRLQAGHPEVWIQVEARDLCFIQNVWWAVGHIHLPVEGAHGWRDWGVILIYSPPSSARVKSDWSHVHSHTVPLWHV